MNSHSEIPSETPPAVIATTAVLSADRPLRAVLADFYELTKPRLNFLVIITTAVGYYMAVRDEFGALAFLNTLAGTGLTAAGAGALNQYVERRYDALMPRTAGRPLPAQRLNAADALVFGAGLGLVGLLYLAATTNLLTALLGAFTLLTYVLVYTPLKRHTTLNTIVGAVPGATPFLMGWTAVRNEISPGGLALLMILFLWQMPHFLAIAAMYRQDYARAGFKMLPVIDPELSLTGRQMVVYTLALIPATLVPVSLQMAGLVYLVAALVLGLAFLWFAVSCATRRGRKESRRLFLASILYLPLLLAFMMIDKL